MASFRFCRPDDGALIVQAINNCQELAKPWDRERYRNQIHQMDLWPGWCSVATDRESPISVLVTAKRGKAAQILVVASHSDHRRKGHASHLVSSLLQKIAILAPETTLSAVVPSEDEPLNALYHSLGFVRDEMKKYCDYSWNAEVLEELDQSRHNTEWVVSTPFEEVDSFFDTSANEKHPWERTNRRLLQSADQLKVLAIPTLDGFAARLVYQVAPEVPKKINVLRLDFRQGSVAGLTAVAAFKLLIDRLKNIAIEGHIDSMVFFKWTEGETSQTSLEELGFSLKTKYITYTHEDR